MGTTTEPGEGLRERKKRLMRQQLSDTAAEMFLARGFDAVRVADVAAACGVSEKTVFNYFPSKEALLLDRLEATPEALSTALARTEVTPLEATLGVLADELASALGSVAGPDRAGAVAAHLRFGDLIDQTPALNAYRSAMTERSVAVACRALASRTGGAPDSPELLITAAALVGLWRVQASSLRRHLERGGDPAGLGPAVTADVERAARVLERGLGGSGHAAALLPSRPGRVRR
ncbi:TetR family transcriptional regulator [Pseudonocardia sp. WMMC193]|uniref:TetR family transcriptional regulator n=1 Tax=Pseudonocardia sp. WMMC193 TaxID=2911965 RepID=UPI001F2F62D0|nr:TetR family transcriptional regulator [Pseudonocardia sp. WMMC193]MCF7548649.1 TetR/AcrR family transcriptional regulator [Pseudonocardia sp. WMMC193]